MIYNRNKKRGSIMNAKTCDHCNNESIVHLAYANRNLCQQHFFNLIEKRFSFCLRQEGMKPKQRVAVALSGGKDSTTLLYLLNKLKSKIPMDIFAITIDEGIAGYRPKSIEKAAIMCKKLGIEHHIVKFSSEVGKSLDEIMEDKDDEPACSYCGVFRRYLLNKAAKELNADLIAVGHNLDDTAQTIFMNLLRNEPSRILRFFKPIIEPEDFVRRIKPLMYIPEKEIAIYAILKGLEFDDGECPYAMRSIRYYIRDMINKLEDKKPGAKFQIVKSMLSLLYEKEQNNEIKKCKVCKMPTNSETCMFCHLKSII
ncbi:MAG: TIGR00269 family protein [Candidatus Anstonellales archaeon]